MNESEDPIEIRIHNPHNFGNENAIDEMLRGVAIWGDMSFEKGILNDGEPQRNSGMLLILFAIIFLGIALFSSLIHIKYKSYRELSATALIIAGWLHGIRCGYLDKKFLELAVGAFEACVDAMEENEEGIYMTEISGPTIPLPVFQKLGYTMVPRDKNWSYGVAALIFAAIEYKRCFGTNKA